MPPKTRFCAVCRRKFPIKGKKLTCSEACRLRRWWGQVEALNKKRAVPKAPIRTCAVCPVEFQPKRRDQKYHGPECAAVGLRRAVEAQQARRRKK